VSTEAQSSDETVQFLEKLAQFHETLSPNEQTMLDELTAAALSDDVQGFGFTNLTTIQGNLTGTGTLTNRPYYNNVAGMLGGGGASYSDRRLKKNVRPL
jgi:hypothetical protein